MGEVAGSSPARSTRAVSSAGRAFAWHAKGQRFDPATVHNWLLAIRYQPLLLFP